MTLATSSDTQSYGLKVVPAVSSGAGRAKRIRSALGLAHDRLPLVDEEKLARYHRYLSENLSFPFTAHYPEPTTPAEHDRYRCVVLELLDPSEHVGDVIDGIFAKTWKSGFEVNLPLVELQVSQDDSDFQLIEDYSYWLWNWRLR
jgi:hypothetical protein